MNKHNFSKLYSFVRQYLKNLWSIFNMEQKKPASPKKKVATQSIPITDSIPEVKVIEKEIKRDYSKVDGMWNRLKNPRGTIYITDVLEAVSNLLNLKFFFNSKKYTAISLIFKLTFKTMPSL